MNAFLAQIAASLPADDAPLLVHADVFRARAAIESTFDPDLLLQRHADALSELAGRRPLLLPVFHYGYIGSRVYRPVADVSEVGALNEYVRTHRAGGRCGAPIFNFHCSQAAAALQAGVAETGDVDPFGADSVFAWVHRSAGRVLMYGAPFGALTGLHYIERLAGGPVYRYDKRFDGHVERDDGSRQPVSLLYHCRPMGRDLDYDWARLRADVSAARLMTVFKGPGAEVLLLDFAALCEFWCERLAADPLYLLNASSRAWVEPLWQQLGRRFLQSDFE